MLSMTSPNPATRFLKIEQIKQSNNSQRGEGKGQWGEGFSGTTIKDIWTKPRGRVGAGEGGRFGWGGVEGCGEMQTTVIEQQ